MISPQSLRMNQIGPHYVIKYFVWLTHLVNSPSLHYIAKSTWSEATRSQRYKIFKFVCVVFLEFLTDVSRKVWLLQLKSVILPLTRSYQLSEDLTLESRWMTNFSIFSNPCWKTKWPLVKVTVLYLTKYQFFNKFNFNTSL